MIEHREYVLAANGLFHIYREAEMETVALRGAGLELEAGTWTSLMGPSGSGKTTLVYVLAALLEPSGGSVILDHRDITRLPGADRARLRRTDVGLVLQRDNLHPLLDVQGNVELPLRLNGRGADEARERAEQLLVELGLRDWRHHRVEELSGGEAQRVAIAVAIAPRPRVLLADEPTGELDEETGAQVAGLFDRVHADGTAIVVVTHNPVVAARAGRHVAMKSGRLIAP
jgi:ABC-type lipoprotein export system ATPase subunit